MEALPPEGLHPPRLTITVIEGPRFSILLSDSIAAQRAILAQVELQDLQEAMQ